MSGKVSLAQYVELRRRFDDVVKNLTEIGKTAEADYHMIYFFLFFEEFDRLRGYIEDSEKMLCDGKW